MNYPNGDHRKLAAYWGQQALNCIQRAVVAPRHECVDHDLDHAVRCARLAVYHALVARPSLRPPVRYGD